MSEELEINVKHKLTTWEAYNYILHGLVKEAIEVFKLDSRVKLTTFQIWTAYLRRNEAAFFNDEERVLPKLPACFQKHDFQLLSNMVRKRKYSEIEEKGPEATQFTKFDLQIAKVDRKMLKQPSGFEQSLVLKPVHRSHLGRRYDKQRLGRSVMYLILFCAINYHHPEVQISDLLRMIHEGRLSYFECRHFLPAELSEEEKIYINKMYTKFPAYLTHRQFSFSLQEFTFFCNVDLNHPNLYVLFERYVTEMALPETFYKFVERLFSLCPIDFEFSANRSSNIPFYEGRAMAYIIFALKLLFGVNGLTEMEMSKSTKRVNDFMEEQKINSKKLFVWSEWVEYFTARKLLLMKHYEQTFIQHETEYSDYSNRSTAHYLNLCKKNFTYRKEEPQMTPGKKNKMPRMMRRQRNFAEVAKNIKEIRKNELKPIDFPPSFTPNASNLEILKGEVEIPEILKEKITERNVEYLIKSSKLKRKFQKFGFTLKTIEAPSNECVSFARNKKDTTKISNYKKNSYRFRIVRTNIDETSYLENIKNEEEQKEMQKMKAKDGESTKKELKTLKDLTKTYLREKRKKFEPQEDDFFSEIESSSDSEPDENTSITLFKPNFDYWTYLEYPHMITQDLYDYMRPEFPESFKWLLENCANLVMMKPYHLYFELLTIETQFLYILKPMHKIRNELVYQDVDELSNNIRSTVKHLHKRFKDGMLIH
ncbi:TATA box-binding protein-associated factor RNA polymerase I subunit B-like [Culicoides brevitarsis]|uniref:TATA box-binding protein-associated factor RNA polymerase I subunit B-like n=1 Tax=Culicoides brevitarsis TaxID=469753 RepID=UPI00307B460B